MTCTEEDVSWVLPLPQVKSAGSEEVTIDFTAEDDIAKYFIFSGTTVSLDQTKLTEFT